MLSNANAVALTGCGFRRARGRIESGRRASRPSTTTVLRASSSDMRRGSAATVSISAVSS
jgi:hypothetical protein